ncbi:MAG: hypothetical protein R3B72_06245 [Polyangiaceae bacterium]
MSIQHQHATMVGLSLLLAAGGCSDQFCTEIGCGPKFTIDVVGDTTPGAIAPGDYELTIETDEGTATCAVGLTGDTNTSCDGGVGISAGAVQGEDGTFISIWGESEPSAISVTVRRDGNVVGSLDANLDYVTGHPNGEDCPPTCRSSLGLRVVVPTQP